MRINNKILQIKLKFICDKLGKKIGYEKGEWNLDYSPCYGGYVVVEFMENGGEDHPILRKRLTASKMSDALDMAINVLLNLSEEVMSGRKPGEILCRVFKA